MTLPEIFGPAPCCPRHSHPRFSLSLHYPAARGLYGLEGFVDPRQRKDRGSSDDRALKNAAQREHHHDGLARWSKSL